MTVKQTQTWEGNNTKLLVRIIISTFVPFPIIIFVIYKKEEKKICSFISLNSTQLLQECKRFISFYTVPCSPGTASCSAAG